MSKYFPELLSALMPALVCKTKMRMKKGTHTVTMVTGKRQSSACMSRVVIPKTDCQNSQLTHSAAHQMHEGKKPHTVTKVSGRNSIDTPVNILMLSPCSMALLLSRTLLPEKSCSLSENISFRVLSFFLCIVSSSNTAFSRP